MGIKFTGTGAADGLFMGPVRRLGRMMRERKRAGDAGAEAQALKDALALAVVDITGLIERVEGEAQDMLAFQLAMLEDDALSAPALAAISAGEDADKAWAAAMNGEIAGYEASDDDYFRARAADLKDMRDRVLRHLNDDAEQQVSAGAVLAGEDIGPTAFLEADWSKGGAIALTRGSTTSHVAMLARARGIPMVVGVSDARLMEARTLIVNGGNGIVIADPGAAEEASYHQDLAALSARRTAQEHFRLKPAARKTGERIELLVNVAGVEELDHIDPASCDGIGLMRSEFLFRDGAPLPNEDMQYEAYRRFLIWAGEKPVTIRTLDIGGDKPIRGLTPEGEANPFLGQRGVRLTLAHERVFSTQLRALLRAAVHGNLKIMIPMVTVPQEITQTAALLQSCLAELRASGTPCRLPPLGIMVEVPAVAVAPELFDAAQFFSIGSNDLTQYVTAASRDDQRVAALNDPSHPAVLRLIRQVARHGRAAGKSVSLCGDMASEPRHVRALLEHGITSLSVAPARVVAVKAAIAEC
jgi:phosphotransferase system enzyme I (PtsI)